ncbi:MAG: chemotaxis protein CheW [Ideonella sp.]|jgi:chemotaxis signal transduction protein|nr:chemotaxis protein CheW [Ideonella sp.]
MSSHAELIGHMHRVQGAERDMRELGLVWQMIESAAAISCPEEVAPILPTLSRTRERFGELQGRLIDRLAAESRAELADELAAKARCAIDILIRNLYERTADVGFLATDDTVREFCVADPATRQAHRASVEARLASYQSKYTVYDDIVLLDPQGTVLARLDAHHPLERSHDPIVAAALQAPGYVEQFAASDLSAAGQPALLYAHRIESPPGRVAGVLVLRFRFEDELQRIFAGMADPRGQIALLLVDEHQRVIATSDAGHVPLGSPMARIAGEDVVLTTFGGREYLSVVCEGRSFQGYRGPRWRAQAMVSLLTAFRPAAGEPDDLNIPLDNPELAQIQGDADEINRDLRRVVWNGELMAQTHPGDRLRLKAVLGQVSTAGLRTRRRVAEAVFDLYRTSLARMRHQSRELARLAADVMDRSFYERANDCRWWALSPAIPALIEAPDGERSTRDLNALLDRLNDAYTVYSRIVVFDASGRVRGVSKGQSRPDLLGRQVDVRWLESVRSLASEQQYAVSGFEATEFADTGPTYTFLAAIRSSTSAGAGLAGGIAVVFDANEQLGAMLQDIMGERPGFAAFVDASGQVLASTDPTLARGPAIGFIGDEALIEHAGHHYACARVHAGGYREFKTSDGYANGVVAVVAMRLGPTDRRRRSLAEEALAQPTLGPRVPRCEYGVFQVGAGRYALPVGALMQAIAQRGLVRAPSALPHAVGLLEVDGGSDPRMVQVVCARSLLGITYPARAGDGVVLVLRSADQPERPLIGLRVDDVLSVVEVDARQVQPAPFARTSVGHWISGIVDCALRDGHGERQDRALLQVVDPEGLVSSALGREALVVPADSCAQPEPA